MIPSVFFLAVLLGATLIEHRAGIFWSWRQIFPAKEGNPNADMASLGPFLGLLLRDRGS
jgi:hypothetical protein